MNDEVISDPIEKKLIRRYREVQRHEEYQYLHLLEDIMENGSDSDDRTGVGTRKIFGTQLKFSLRDSFPILTTKKTYWKGIVEELLWFIRGDTNANHLSEKGVRIWDGNTTREFLDKQGLEHPEGFIGPGYGWQWRNWNKPYQSWRLEGDPFLQEDPHKGIDQLSEALHKIKNKPDDRRILVSAWNPSQVPEMALPPCHLLFQFQVSNGELHCQWYQRSVDCFLGLPFNISSYALLTCLMAKAADLTPGSVTFCGGDTHIYKNHIDQVKEQLSRTPYDFPQLELPDVKTIQDIENLTLDDCKLVGYNSHKSIKAEMAV
jgi:dihydrofolate reductase/thymidylate synthase